MIEVLGCVQDWFGLSTGQNMVASYTPPASPQAPVIGMETTRQQIASPGFKMYDCYGQGFQCHSTQTGYKCSYYQPPYYPAPYGYYATFKC